MDCKLILKALTLTFFICGTSSSEASAQQTNLDSLNSVWQDETLPDTVRTMAYKDLIWNGFLYSNPDTASTLADELITFGLKKENLLAQAMGFNIKGVAYYLRGEYHRAIDYFNRRLKIAEQMGDDLGRSNAFNKMGVVYYRQGNYPKAINYYSRSLKIVERFNDRKGMASTLGNLGLIYSDLGDFQKALDYYSQSVEIHELLGSQSGIAITVMNMGLIYSDQGDYQNALDYCNRSLKIKVKMGNQNGVAFALQSIGGIYSKQGDYQKALNYYNQSLKISEQLGNQGRMATSLKNIGTIYQVQGNHRRAVEVCEKSLDLATAVGELEGQINACQCLYISFKGLNNCEKSLELHERLTALNDSLESQDMGEVLQQMEFERVMLQDSIANAEEARLIEEAHQDEVLQKNQTRNMLAAGGLLVLLLAGGIYGRLHYIRKAKETIEKEKDRSNNLLLNILPADIAEELKIHGKAEARDFEMVSILFTDFKGFTEASARLSAAELVSEINTCFEAFDGIMDKYGIEKIKTIGDAYMAAGGLPLPSDKSAKNTVLAALEMQDFIGKRKIEMDALNKPSFEMRVGIHTGPVVAGIVGVKKFQYDVWGDTVNTAARMESSSVVEKVNISQATYELLQNDLDFTFESRGKIAAKGKGEIEMYFVKNV